MRGRSFRLNSATIGIVGEKETTVVPAGTLITVVSEPDTTKFVYVLEKGRKIRMFIQDVQERGIPVVNESMSATETP